MRGLSLLVALSAGCVFVADDPDGFPTVEGGSEHEVSGEGEGEGEGAAAAGDGGGDVSPVVGEGEGEIAPVGEGEGEIAPVGEGEGEVAPVGEGEGEGEGEPGPADSETVCDGLDDDNDGEIDEIEGTVERLAIRFDPASALFPSQAFLHVTDGLGAPADGSPFTGNELRDIVVIVEGDTVRIRLEADDSEPGLFGYAVVSIVDQTGRRPPANLPLPASGHPHDTPIDDEQVFVMPDTLGMGLRCGTDVGPCEFGREQCVGRTLCVGGVKPDDEVCNDIDDDCDGEVDDELDLTDRPECPLTEGVCEGKAPTCDDGVYAVCNSLVYGPGVFEADEAACDCLDNDCDGEVDEVGCDIDALAAVEETQGRDCVLRGDSIALFDSYRFGSLEIAEGATVRRSAAGGCGVRGSASGGFGGGCLTLQADRIVVAGLVAADAEFLDCRFSCGGGSGGDVVLLASEVVVAPTGRLRATGSIGKRNSNETGGSGAGGSVRVRAESISIQGELLCQGGPTRDGGGPGGGAGGVGGSGRQPGAGGATAGVRDGAGGLADPDRPLELIGEVTLGEGASLLSRQGGDTPDGHVRLVGAALGVQGALELGVTLEALPLGIRVTGPDGQPVPDATVTVTQAGRDGDALVGTTGVDGWAFGDVDPALALDLPASVAFEHEDAALVGGRMTWTYGDPAGRGTCTAGIEIGGDPAVAEAPPTEACDRP